jgi:hypothetical protein
VGSGDGYDTTTIALPSPAQEIIACNGSEDARRHCRDLAAANHVTPRIRVEGWCNPEDLARALRDGANPVLMDVEGAEEILLDPVRIPQLANAWILFEQHDIIPPGIGGRGVRHFPDTHDTVGIGARTRQPQDLTFLPRFHVNYIQDELFGRLLERPDRPERMRWSPQGQGAALGPAWPGGGSAFPTSADHP